MKPEDVTDEMLDAAQAVADQASLFGDPWEAKRAVLAAAINAMPPAARGVAGTLRTLYGGCPFCGCPDCVAGECRRVGSMPKPDFAPPGYTDKLVERIATIDPLPAQDMSSDPPLMPQSEVQAQIDAAQEELRLCQQDAIKLQDECIALKAERDALRIEIRVAEDALQKALSALAVSFEDCCADTGTIIPAKVEHLVSEAKMRIQRRPDPAKGAPRPAGHNPVA